MNTNNNAVVFEASLRSVSEDGLLLKPYLNLISVELKLLFELNIVVVIINGDFAATLGAMAGRVLMRSHLGRRRIFSV